MVEKLKQAWKRDARPFVGVGSVALAFLLWAWPSIDFSCTSLCNPNWFNLGRIPAALGFFAYGVGLLVFLRLFRKR
jgi:hypothetical protein